METAEAGSKLCSVPLICSRLLQTSEMDFLVSTFTPCYSHSGRMLSGLRRGTASTPWLRIMSQSQNESEGTFSVRTKIPRRNPLVTLSTAKAPGGNLVIHSNPQVMFILCFGRRESQGERCKTNALAMPASQPQRPEEEIVTWSPSKDESQVSCLIHVSMEMHFFPF